MTGPWTSSSRTLVTGGLRFRPRVTWRAAERDVKAGVPVVQVPGDRDRRQLSYQPSSALRGFSADFPAVQRLLKRGLAFLRQRGLEHRTAIFAQCLDRLVRGHFLDHQEECRSSRLDDVTDLVLEFLIDPGL